MAHKLKLSKKALRSASFSKLNLLIFIAIFASIGGYTLLNSHAAGSTANVFVSPNGSDTGANCKRFATAQTNPDSGGTSLCASFQKAYDIAAPSDIIEVETGNYTGQTIMRDSQSQNGPMITLKCAVAKQCILSGYITLGANNGGPTGVAPSYLTFDGFDAAGFSEPTSGIDTDSNNQPITAVQSTNITITNSWFHHWGCCAQNSSETLVLVGSDNFTIQNSEVGPACCSNDGFETAGWYDPVSGTQHTMQNLTIDSVYVHDLFDTCGGTEGAATLYPGQCSGTGYGDCQTCGYDHNDGIQLYDGDNVVIKNSKWIRAGTQAIFVALYSAGDARLHDMTIENNMISNVLSGGNNDFSIGSQAGAGKISGTINILYNTVQKVTALGTLNDCPGGGNCYGAYDSTAAVNIVGNIFNDFTLGNDGPVNGCNLWAYNSSTGTDTTITPNFSHNLINGANGSICGSTDINGTPTYLDSSYDTPDLHLAAGSTGINQGESAYCPSIDIDGQNRPQDAACDLGADEYVPAANLWVSTTGNDSTCARGDPAKPCATWGKAWQLACGGDTVSLAAGTYSSQQIAADTTCNKGAASPVTFKPDSGAAVTLDGVLTLGANNGQATGDAPSGFTLDGASRLTIHGGIYTWYETAYASNITLENFHIWHTEASYGNGGANDLFGAVADNLTVRNVEIGPICCNASGIDIGRPAAASRDAQNIVLDHLNVHDVVNSCSLLPVADQPTCSDTYDSSHHVDGLHIWGADGLQITNSKWLNSSGQVLYLEGVNGGQFNNTLIENNMIASTGAEPIVIVTSSSASTYSTTYPLITG
ncbi:MAG TPA: choice-of-anchor Q domain-containing protein, partial [Candidatus Saccharimonadales bacterium]|nr:choice-of-anchor Q domain-containing protein [Candidatus Saccharimonadales bacterium]